MKSDKLSNRKPIEKLSKLGANMKNNLYIEFE